jgi:8-oxo-dGTP pyrophosphatase MutT (NUDIX family)
MKRPPILDPRGVPLDASHLESAPALPADRLTVEAIRRRFSVPPNWQPEFVDDAYRLDGVPLRPAAVLIALLDRPGGVTLLLTLRSEALLTHSGQVSFPGGRVDQSDGGVVEAALRETREEVGIEPDAIEILGEMPQYTTGTGYVITPVVALVDPALDLSRLKLEPAEVAEVFEVPLRFLMDPANHQRRLFRWRQDDADHQRGFFSMPWRPDPAREQEYFIWGATAAMLRNLYRFLAAE